MSKYIHITRRLTTKPSIVDRALTQETFITAVRAEVYSFERQTSTYPTSEEFKQQVANHTWNKN